MSQRAEKVRKAPPKRRRKRRGEPEVVPVTPELLADAPLFRHLEYALRGRLSTRMEHVAVERGEHLIDGAPPSDDESTVLVILFGDVSVHRDDAQGDHIVNYLSVGEPYVQKLFRTDSTRALRVTAMCPVRALKVVYRDVNYVLRKDEGFRDDFSAAVRAVTERQATRFDDVFQQDIARFLVEERLTFAGRVKLKRMDICIECDGCYDACRDRHGTDRLGASEVKYGLTEVPQNCHNCVVPECMDKCKFGHITRHPGTGEIVIADDCTGCTMCAKGCSFGSIRMHSLADLDVARYFPDRSPDAVGKNIAQKCDNCTGYADQACITACPTGAMFQVDGVDLFKHWEQFNVHEAPGFDEIASPERPAARARTLWMSLALLNFFVLTWECFGRLMWPDLTFGAWFHAQGWSADPIDPEAPFKAGDYFSHGMGYIGSFALIGTQLYRLGKWLAPRFGSVQAWMESHIWLGIIGATHGFYHTAFVFSEPIAVATFATMMVAVLTGVVGRYLLFLVPRSQAGKQLELAELDANIQALNREIEGKFKDRRVSHTMMMRVDELTQAVEGDAEQRAEAEQGGFLTSVRRLIRDDRAKRKAIEGLAGDIDGNVADGAAGDVVGMLKQKARLERSMRRHGFLGKVLKRYRIVHVVSSNIMFGALVLHVVFSLMYAVGN